MRNFRVTAILLLSVAAACQTGPTSEQVITPITLVAPITAWTWPMYIAQEAGYYEKHGLDVSLVFANHPAGIAMVTSGQAEVNVNSLEKAMELAVKDDSFTIVGSPVRTWLFALMGRKGLNNPRGLEGGTLGIAQFGDSTHRYALSLLARFGIRESDVGLLVVGAAGRVPALTRGFADAVMLSAPAYFALEDAGYPQLANISDYDDLYTPSVLLISREAIRRNPQLAERLVRAHAEAVHRFYEDRDFAVEAHRTYDPQDRSDLERVYATYVESEAFQRIPYIVAPAVDYVIDNTSDVQLHGEMLAFDYGTVIDNATVDRLVRSGFFRQLFTEWPVHAREDTEAAQAFR